MMAIYFFRNEFVQKSKNHSVMCRAAYQAGEILHEKRMDGTRKRYNFSDKDDVYLAEIIAPRHVEQNPALRWIYNREEIWNSVAYREPYWNSQYARAAVIAICRELQRRGKNDQERYALMIDLVRRFILRNYVSVGMIVDVAYHNLGGDNPHVHILMTLRKISAEGEWLLKERPWGNINFAKKTEKSWADLTNAALKKVGSSARIDHRSYADRGINKIPQIYMKKSVKALEDKGINTRIGDKNRQIRAVNQELEDAGYNIRKLQREILAEQELERKLSRVDRRNAQVEDTEASEHAAQEVEPPQESVLARLVNWQLWAKVRLPSRPRGDDKNDVAAAKKAAQCDIDPVAAKSRPKPRPPHWQSPVSQTPRVPNDPSSDRRASRPPDGARQDDQVSSAHRSEPSTPRPAGTPPALSAARPGAPPKDTRRDSDAHTPVPLQTDHTTQRPNRPADVRRKIKGPDRSEPDDGLDM